MSRRKPYYKNPNREQGMKRLVVKADKNGDANQNLYDLVRRYRMEGENNRPGTLYNTYGPIGTWDVSNVTDMSELFNQQTDFNYNINDWNVSNVTDMSRMFLDAHEFNQPLDKWDVGNVRDMSRMFLDAENFNQDISRWDVSNVTNMEFMFHGAYSFNQPLEEWNVSNVIDMANMFSDRDVDINVSSFNQPLNKWGDKLTNVKDMSEMFLNAKSFNQPINNWNISPDTDIYNMTLNSGLEIQNMPVIILRKLGLNVELKDQLNNTDECVICYESLKDKPSNVLPCGHSFHRECIHNWLTRGNNTCPTCREPFKEENLRDYVPPPSGGTRRRRTKKRKYIKKRQTKRNRK